MKNIKKSVATLGLLGIIIMSATSAQAGLVMAGRSAAPSNPTTIERVLNSIRNIVIGEITGVTIQDDRDGLVMAGRTGIMLSD
jgi:hypothetical protein